MSTNCIETENYIDRPSILVFLKAPEAGKVKTRLETAFPRETVVDLYRKFVLDTLEKAARTGYCIRICFHPPGQEQRIREWLSDYHDFFPQQGADIGSRMANAFIRAFAQGHSEAVCMGTDIPDLPVDVIHDAVTSLKQYPCTIGPATDGGYYLIGFQAKTFSPAAFRQICWSTDRVFDQTMAILERKFHRIHILPKWSDIDDYHDLMGFYRRNCDNSHRAQNTMAFLKSIGLGLTKNLQSS